MTKLTLKTYFETGDRPTQAQFVELIDAMRIESEVQDMIYDAIESLDGGAAATVYSGETIDGGSA